MANCQNQKKNLASCNCSYQACSRKGICCECVSYHRDLGQIPACFFPSDIEKTYNRSIDNFIRSQDRGK